MLPRMSTGDVQHCTEYGVRIVASPLCLHLPLHSPLSATVPPHPHPTNPVQSSQTPTIRHPPSYLVLANADTAGYPAGDANDPRLRLALQLRYSTLQNLQYNRDGLGTLPRASTPTDFA